MVRPSVVVLLGLLLVAGGARAARAEVSRVEMKIGGYLCGN